MMGSVLTTNNYFAKFHNYMFKMGRMGAMKVGYQGIEGSNSEYAAKKMVEDLGMLDLEFVPLVKSDAVVAALKCGSIDFGVMAIENSIGGRVEETFNAIQNKNLKQVAVCQLPIHHCLFVKNSDAVIDTIASHIQALKQTSDTRKAKYPDCVEMEIEDTAIGAKYLATGELPETTGVLCRKEAGESNGLVLLAENLEDDKTNHTEFRMFKDSE